MHTFFTAKAVIASVRGGFLSMAISAVLVACWSPMMAQQTKIKEVNGHVLRGDDYTPLENALVVAWPCQQLATTDRNGFYQIQCPEGIDSIACTAAFFIPQTETVVAHDHIDFQLQPLNVDLNEATVVAASSPEAEAVRLQGTNLLQALDRTPGLQSLDLGNAMVQPVIRGLMGSRVAVLEDGVPQQGGRWGADHGILADLALSGGTEWVPGGGHVWMGPQAVGGGLRLIAPQPAMQEGRETTMGASYRLGDHQIKSHALHAVTRTNRFWYAGASLARFSNQNIPQNEFRYIGRTYILEDGVLPNTAGISVHGTAGFQRTHADGSRLEGAVRISDVVQGLFPGIVGVPRQGDLGVAEELYAVDIPQQHASRVKATFVLRSGVKDRRSVRTVKGALGWNRRLELAPPHAHGWGPEPDSNLSLGLGEWNGFLESAWRGIHGSWGVQLEGLAVDTEGWEFLLPTHRRIRGSLIGDRQAGPHRFGIRADIVGTSHAGHEEPLYNSEGTVIGVDRRVEDVQRLIPGGMASWSVDLNPASGLWTGAFTAALHSRAPSNYELGANGIHHGTFRFERGNADLAPEKSIEGRFRMSSSGQASDRVNWQIQGFSAWHWDFIALSPTGSFAPISHAGQVYAFEAVDAFRTGLEASVDVAHEAWTASANGSVLGQWDVETGLGLPFTSPAQLHSTLGRKWRNQSLQIGCRAIADAQLTARNEATTEGALLWELDWQLAREAGTWSIGIHNLANTAWLDHTSAYRALDLVAQGRWIQFGFNARLKQPSS